MITNTAIRSLLIVSMVLAIMAMFNAQTRADQWYEFYEQAMMSYEAGDYPACVARAEMAFQRNTDSGTYTVRGKVVEYFPHWLICECNSKQKVNDMVAQCHCASSFDDSVFEGCVCNCDDNSYSTVVTEDYTWRPTYSYSGAQQTTSSYSSATAYQVPLVIDKKSNVSQGSPDYRPATDRPEDYASYRERDWTPAWMQKSEQPIYTESRRIAVESEKSPSEVKLRIGQDDRGTSAYKKNDRDWTPAWMPKDGTTQETSRPATTSSSQTSNTQQQDYMEPVKFIIGNKNRIRTETDAQEEAAYYSAMGRNIQNDIEASANSSGVLDEDQKEDLETLAAIGVLAVATNEARKQRERERQEALRNSGELQITILKPEGEAPIFKRVGYEPVDVDLHFKITEAGRTLKQVLVNQRIICETNCRATLECPGSKVCSEIKKTLTYKSPGYLTITAIDTYGDRWTKTITIRIQY